MRGENSNSENIKKMIDVYDPDFWQTFLDYTIRSTEKKKHSTSGSYLLLRLYFFFFFWLAELQPL